MRGRGARRRRRVSSRAGTSRWSGCSRGRCGEFSASTGRASRFWADAGAAARRRRRLVGAGQLIRGRSMGGGLVVELGRREGSPEDADMDRLRWSAPRVARPFRIRQAVGCFSTRSLWRCAATTGRGLGRRHVAGGLWPGTYAPNRNGGDRREAVAGHAPVRQGASRGVDALAPAERGPSATVGTCPIRWSRPRG